ncbi:MAG: hypothetical protein JSS97_06035 [Actinobacteria bacterium]|nr:hypothetical protein [Actinomycetota bacterium]
MENPTRSRRHCPRSQVGFGHLAAAISDEAPSTIQRMLDLMRGWGDRGFSREKASGLFRGHGFSPQTAGGWTMGDRIEMRDDGRGHLTERSHGRVAEQKNEGAGDA